MSKQANQRSAAVGLDIGTSRIVAALTAGDGFDCRSQLNSFVSIPFSKMTEKALARENVPFVHEDNQLVILGDESLRFAGLLGLEPRRPMKAGVLNPLEADSARIIGRIVESLLGEAGGNGGRTCFSVPAPPLDGEANVTYHEAAIRDLLAPRGCQATCIDEGLAVIYGELEDSNYTGIGVSCGGGLCNVCLAYLSVPVVSFSIAKAGDYIDVSTAAVTGDRASRIRIEKETSFHFNGATPSKLHQALRVYYDDMIADLLRAMTEALARTARMPKFQRPVPLVLSGGTALPQGFAPRFEEALRAAELPVPVAEVRLANDPLDSTARGALMAALAES